MLDRSAQSQTLDDSNRSIRTSNNAERDLASRIISFQVTSLLSRVGAFPRMKRDDLARVSATFIRRMSVHKSVRSTGIKYSATYLRGNQLTAGQVPHERTRE